MEIRGGAGVPFLTMARMGRVYGDTSRRLA
jgi:hypothetical protein